MKSTTRGVAQQAHVSMATISCVLSEKAKSYHPEAATGIGAIAKGLGYKKNLAAARSAANSGMLTAVILNNTQTDFSNDITAATQVETDKAGYQIFILCAGNRNAQLLNQVTSVVLERHVIGVPLVVTSLDEQVTHTSQEGNTLCRLASVYNETDPRYIGFKFTGSSNEKTGYLAANYLVGWGYSRIGLADIDHPSAGRQRLCGYQQAMIGHGLVPHMGWAGYGDYSFDPQQDILRTLTSKNLDVIITTSDMITVGMIREAHLLGLDVPGDLSFISTNEAFLYDITIPTTISITQDFYQMRLIVARNLLNDDNPQFIPIYITP